MNVNFVGDMSKFEHFKSLSTNESYNIPTKLEYTNKDAIDEFIKFLGLMSLEFSYEFSVSPEDLSLIHI